MAKLKTCTCYGFGCSKCNGEGYVAVKERKPREYREASEQGSIAGYIKKYHPGIIFHTTRVEGKKEFWEQNQIKRLNSHTGFPDTFILEPRGKYHGLMIENKKSGTKLFKRDGSYASEHFANQAATHELLRAKGYAVKFAVGVVEAIETLENYLKGELF